MSGDQYTYTRPHPNGRDRITVTQSRKGTLSRFEATVRHLAEAGQLDGDIGATLGLSAKQVEGIRRRAVPRIDSPRGSGRPRGSRNAR